MSPKSLRIEPKILWIGRERTQPWVEKLSPSLDTKKPFLSRAQRGFEPVSQFHGQVVVLEIRSGEL